MKAFFITSFLCSCFFCFARDVEESFLKANREYQNKNYEKALELYQSIEKKGPATWCNMGNCSFKLKKYVDALVCWRRAKKNVSRVELIDLNKNIAAVDQLLGRAPKAGSLEFFLDNLLGRFSLFSFQFIFLFFWLSLFGFLFFLKKRKAIFLSVLIPLNFVFGFGLFAKYRLHSCSQAIVIDRTASLFVGPDEKYLVVCKPNFADEVRVIDQKENWCKVKVNGLSGWMLADNLAII